MTVMGHLKRRYGECKKEKKEREREKERKKVRERELRDEIKQLSFMREKMISV